MLHSSLSTSFFSRLGQFRYLLSMEGCWLNRTDLHTIDLKPILHFSSQSQLLGQIALEPVQKDVLVAEVANNSYGSNAPRPDPLNCLLWDFSNVL